MTEQVREREREREIRGGRRLKIEVCLISPVIIGSRVAKFDC